MVEEGARHGGEAALCVPELVTTLKAGTKKMITRGRGYGGKGEREKARAGAKKNGKFLPSISWLDLSHFLSSGNL
jgi:hypothetical protein